MGAWAVDAFDRHQIVTQEGKVFFGKKIRAFALLPIVRSSAGQPRSFNSAGQLIYRAANADNTQSILKVQMPVPVHPE